MAMVPFIIFQCKFCNQADNKDGCYLSEIFEFETLFKPNTGYLLNIYHSMCQIMQIMPVLLDLHDINLENVLFSPIR